MDLLGLFSSCQVPPEPEHAWIDPAVAAEVGQMVMAARRAAGELERMLNVELVQSAPSGHPVFEQLRALARADAGLAKALNAAVVEAPIYEQARAERARAAAVLERLRGLIAEVEARPPPPLGVIDLRPRSLALFRTYLPVR